MKRCLAGLLVGCAFAYAAPALLPAPKQVRFADAQLPLAGYHLELQSPTQDPENDRAAELLRTALHNAGVEPGRGPLIRLERTANTSSWQWDDPAGPHSSEAYTLSVGPSGVTLRAATARGLYYASQTLRQLIEGHGATAFLQHVEIQDWPSLRLRGFMLDLSHGPFPRFEEILRHIDLLARFKANQFYLYSETNIELEGFELLSARARLSQDEVRRLVRYARERFIDVVPCVELYGHLHDLLRVEHYADLGETIHGGELDPLSPAALRLLDNWVEQFTRLFPSPFFHIGLDETYELGHMPGRELTRQAAGERYLAFFEKISALVNARNRRVMVWADIILQHPEVIPRLTPGTIAVPWRYQDQPSYHPLVAPLAAAGLRFLVAPGIWNYNEAAPDFDHTIRNVNGFLASAARYPALGLLHTEWTDNGQVFLNMADPGVVIGMDGAWTGGPVVRETFYERYARIVHPSQAKEFSEILQATAEAQGELEAALGKRGMFALWTDPYAEPTLSAAHRNMAKLRHARRRAEDAQISLLRLLRREDHAAFRSLLYGARLMDYLALRYLYAVEIAELHQALTRKPTRDNYRLFAAVEMSDFNHSRLVDLMEMAGELSTEMNQLWLQQYTPFRLASQQSRWTAELERWRALQQKLMDGFRTFRDGQTVPPLSEFVNTHH